jgi:next-to-BRCA1 protein 1
MACGMIVRCRLVTRSSLVPTLAESIRVTIRHVSLVTLAVSRRDQYKSLRKLRAPHQLLLNVAAMFTVKATYRNETRKFSFSGTVLFPTYEELYQQVRLALFAYLFSLLSTDASHLQLYRIFPISHNYYLSKLIFSPDASKPSRILIGKEVHNAEEYSTRIAPLRRRWSNPLLRFSIFDETPHKVPSVMAEGSGEVPGPLSFMAIPPPPTLLSTPAPPNLLPTSSIDTRFQEFLAFKAANPPPPSSRPLPTLERPNVLMPPISPSSIPPPPLLCGYPSLPSLPSLLPQAASPQPCCSISKGKSEMEALLASFKKDIDRIMLNTFGERNTSAQVNTSHPQTPFGIGISDEAPHTSSKASYDTTNISIDPPSHWCFVCRNEFSGSWYGCVKCPWHYVVRIFVLPMTLAWLNYLLVSKLFL